MLDSVIIIGVVALLIAILQASVTYFQTDVGQMWLKLIMFAMAGALNIINGVAFSGDTLTTSIILGYFKDGLIWGAAASGIYGMGKDLTNSTATLRGNHLKQNILYIPAKKFSFGTIFVGICVWMVASMMCYFGADSVISNIFCAIGFVVVMLGYFIGAFSATRHQHKGGI